MGGLQDAVLGLFLIGIIALPIVWLSPAFISSLVDLVRGLFISLLYLTVALILLVFVLGTALIAEKAVRRWKGEVNHAPTSSASGGEGSGTAAQQEEQKRFGVVSPDAPEYEKRRARRVARESRFEEAAEVVIDKLEKTGVGKLLKRKVKGSASSSRKRGAADEVVELSDVSRTAATTAVRRTPPPPPPLPPR